MQKSAIVVEDDANTSLALTKAIRSLGFSVRAASTLKEAQNLYREACPDVVLLDVTLPDGDGLDLMRENSGAGAARFVVVTGDSRQEVAVRSLRARATDFLVKPVTMANLRSAIEKPASAANDDPHNSPGVLPESIQSASTGITKPVGQSFGRMLAKSGSSSTGERSDMLLVGESSRSRQLNQSIQQLAEINSNVIVSGEAGVDKIAAAYALHRRTPYRSIIAHIQCATGNVMVGDQNIVNGFSECLSSVFTVSHKEQRVTLILDDVEQLNEVRQREILSYLTSHSLINAQLGATPRIVSIQRSPNQTARLPVMQGQLNTLLPDLQCCVGQSHLAIPALRQRRDDILPMSHKLLDSLNAGKKNKKILSEKSIALMKAHDWPGNTRELVNVVTQAYHSSEHRIEVEDSLPIDNNGESLVQSADALVGKSFWEVEKALLQATLKSHEGDKKTTANTLGISLKTLYNRLNAYNINFKAE